MELSTTTFILEIINFAVLVWILKRFLYAPILKAIQARKDAVQKTLDSAEEARKQALEMNEKYEGRLREWEKEKEEYRGALRRELDQERERSLTELQASLTAEREKSKATDQKKLSEMLEKQESQSAAQALKFASRLLERFASPELESRLIQAFLDDLTKLPPTKLREWKARTEGKEIEARVQTAFCLPTDIQERVATRLTEALGKTTHLRFERDPSIVAGIRVQAGLLVLQADLADELASFSEARIS